MRDYFNQFGEVLECTVMRDPTTQRSRGFAFLTMKDNESVDRIVSQSDHNLDGKRVRLLYKYAWANHLVFKN